MVKPIEFYCNESQIMNDAIDGIIVKIHAYKKKTGGKSFLLSGCGTQAGTTMISVNLAVALAMSGWKVLYVDCDLRKGNQYKRLGEQADRGMVDFLTTEIKKEEVIENTNYENLFYLPSGRVYENPIRLLVSQKMECLINEVKTEYDYIIYDLPSLNVVSDANVLFTYMDGIILVAGLQKNTKHQIREGKRKMVEVEQKYLGMIINNVDMHQYKKYMKDFDYFAKESLQKRYENVMKKAEGNVEERKWWKLWQKE